MLPPPSHLQDFSQKCLCFKRSQSPLFLPLSCCLIVNIIVTSFGLTGLWGQGPSYDSLCTLGVPNKCLLKLTLWKKYSTENYKRAWQGNGEHWNKKWVSVLKRTRFCLCFLLKPTLLWDRIDVFLLWYMFKSQKLCVIYTRLVILILQMYTVNENHRIFYLSCKCLLFLCQFSVLGLICLLLKRNLSCLCPQSLTGIF